MDKKIQAMLASAFAMHMMLDPYGTFMDDIDDIIDSGIRYDQKAKDCKFYMMIELIKLLDDGYTEEELYKMIDSLDVEGMNELSEQQQNYVKDEAKKLLLERKRMKNYE